MPDITGDALPWILGVAPYAAGGIMVGVAFLADRHLRHFRDWLVGRISGLPILIAAHGCHDCTVQDGEPHRYAGCPANLRQHEARIAFGGDKNA